MALLLDPANDRLHRIHDEIMFFNQASDAPAPSPHDLAVDHVRVAEAIRRRDTRAAEMAMRKHCDKLIAAGEAYRSQTDGTSLSSFEPTVTGQIGTPRVRPM
jgi:DNA-binding GntR family transcriptional regulator